MSDNKWSIQEGIAVLTSSWSRKSLRPLSLNFWWGNCLMPSLAQAQYMGSRFPTERLCWSMDEPGHVRFKSYVFSDDSPDVSSDEVGLWGRSRLPGKGSLSHAKYVVTISFALFKYVVKCLDLLKEPQDTPYRFPISTGFPIRNMNHIQQINDYAVFMHPFPSFQIPSSWNVFMSPALTVTKGT